VAEYKGKIKPDQLGIMLIKISQMYNNAIIAPENNSGWSGQTILKIEEAKYPYLYYSRRRKIKGEDPGLVDPYYAAGRNEYLPGYSVTSANRIQMLAKVEQYIRLADIVINSSRFISELKTFVIKENNRPEALRGYNDDLIMALAGCLWIREEAFMHIYRSDEYAKAMIDAMSVSSLKATDSRDFNMISGKNIYDRGRVVEHVQEQNKIRIANGDEISLDWLISPIFKG